MQTIKIEYGGNTIVVEYTIVHDEMEIEDIYNAEGKDSYGYYLKDIDGITEAILEQLEDEC